MPFNTNGTLVTDQREIAISDTWETQTDWEAYQSNSNIDISNGTLSLTEFTALDVSMFSDPQYQFYAASIEATDGDSPVPFPETLAGLSSATAVGSPTYRVDKNGQYDTVDYADTTDNYGHNWDAENDSVTGDAYSVAALIWLNSPGDNVGVFSWGSGTEAFLIIDISGSISVAAGTSDPDRYGTVPTGEFSTVGFSFSNGNYNFYINGSNVGSESSGTPDSIDTGNIGIGYSRERNNAWFDGFITEVVVSNTEESGTAFSDYHNNRLP